MHVIQNYFIDYNSLLSEMIGQYRENVA